MPFNVGDQVAYIPRHANGDLTHPDVEFGFVTGVKGDTVFCRYFYRSGKLRTVSNSEGAYKDDLIQHTHMPQERVDIMLRQLGYR